MRKIQKVARSNKSILASKPKGPGGNGVTRGIVVPRRDELLLKTGRLFAEKGFDSVTMEFVGATIGISGPALYRHFSNKRAILVAIFDRIREGLEDTVDAALEVAPRLRLDLLIRRQINTALDEADLIQMYVSEERNLM